MTSCIVLISGNTIQEQNIRSALQRYDVAVEVVGTHQMKMGLTVPQGCRPAAIILDTGVSSIDSYEVCRTLKQDASTRDIPVIFLSSHDEVQAVLHAFAVGADDFIVSDRFAAHNVVESLRYLRKLPAIELCA